MRENTNLSRRLLLRALTTAASTLAALLLLELLGRIIFFQMKAPTPIAAVWLYDDLVARQRVGREAQTQARIMSGEEPAPKRLDGIALNREAWQASFEERGLTPNSPEPREGYWGARINPKKKGTYLRYTERELTIPNFVDVDAEGFQHVKADHSDSGLRILILGGSVAFGAYASTIDDTYFSVIHRLLSNKGIDNDVFVLASGAWTSYDELLALVMRGIDKNPDIVVFLNGLNDLTNLGNDWPETVDRYLNNMRKAKVFVVGHGKTAVFALQPFLPEKEILTPYERRILDVSPNAYELAPFYQRIRDGLSKLHDGSGAYFVDCSNVLAKEEETTFTDLWHFSDPGHVLLGEHLGTRVYEIARTTSQGSG